MVDLKKLGEGLFESIRRIGSDGGFEYWRARDLQRALGYERWENFEEAINRAMAACEESGYSRDDQFRETTKMIEVGKTAKRSVKDYFLSRYACYLIAMNGDPSKPSIAAAQTYFAVQTRRQELAELLTDDEKRLTVRDRVRESNTELNKTASRSGVKNFAFFHDAGYRGMYAMSQGAAKRRKGIEPREDFLDCVGRLELAANEFRITLTEERLRKEQVKGQAPAENVHEAVGRKVRKTVHDEIGEFPEELPRAESIKQVEKRTRKQLKNK
jgi:DNA-damage-inducible protein D